MRRRAIAAAGALSLTALLLALLLPTGCNKRPEAPPNAPSATGAATVSLDDAANATYASDNTRDGALRLTDGHYEDTDLVQVDLEEFDATGDLDNDGVADRVVLLSTSTGGSGLFRDIYVLRRSNGQLTVSPPGFLGDRVVVNDLRIERGEIVADLVVQGADDPLCCPTQPVIYRFRLAGNLLTEISGQQRVYLKE